jgi:putative Mn2+ efflux pump MntP
MLGVGVLYPSLVIGAVAAAMTLVGMRFGGALGSRFGRWMELAGGLALLGIGLKILHEHGVF